MINIIVDHDMDQILINGTDYMGDKIDITIPCNDLRMSKLQNLIYELINVISSDKTDATLYKRDEGRDTYIASW